MSQRKPSVISTQFPGPQIPLWTRAVTQSHIHTATHKTGTNMCMCVCFMFLTLKEINGPNILWSLHTCSVLVVSHTPRHTHAYTHTHTHMRVSHSYRQLQLVHIRGLLQKTRTASNCASPTHAWGHLESVEPLMASANLKSKRGGGVSLNFDFSLQIFYQWKQSQLAVLDRKAMWTLCVYLNWKFRYAQVRIKWESG